MRIFKDVVQPETIRSVLQQTTCDLCKVDIETTIGNWERCDITVERIKGDTFPESGAYTTTSFDLCSKCFDRLTTWMESQGATPTVKEFF